MSFKRLVEASLDTHQGRVRGHNEDFVTFEEPSNNEEEARNGWLYVVADGVGGADAGEVASEFASSRTVEHYLKNNHTTDWGQRLLEAMQAANTELRQLVADRDDRSRMATTMVATVIRNGHAFIANVGDSRGYLWRKGELTQITKDHSLVAKLVEEGAITEAEAAIHPRKNVILYSLGSENNPRIDLFEQPLQQDDILLLCSDGLTRHVTDEELAEIISQQDTVTATETLINLANSRGGEDNISVALLLYDRATRTAPKLVVDARRPVRPSHIRRERSLLWLYTAILSLVQTVIMILVWLLLRV